MSNDVIDVSSSSFPCVIAEVIVKSPNPEQAWRATMSFCEITVREQHGPVAAVKLLSTGMQSTDESVALKSLEVLETAVRRCGPRFQVNFFSGPVKYKCKQALEASNENCL